MRYGVADACAGHDPGPRHPDTPDRIDAIRRRLAPRDSVEYAEPGPARRAVVEAVHDPGYLDELRAFCENGGGKWDPDTVATPGTWPAAMASAGLAVWAAREAREGATGAGTPFSLGRPPGHHAISDDARGFCFLNNAAIAAQHLRETGTDRVAIVDWDAHHGDGGQDVFYDRSDVLFVSVHEDDLYPPTGGADETGTGPGAGATVNVPLPSGAGDPEYRVVFESVVLPVLRRFAPEVVLVSAGFDAHRNDPISRLHLTAGGYGMLAAKAREAARDAGAGLGFVLEGGYHNFDALGDSVGAVHDVVHGHRPAPEDGDPDTAVESLVADLRERHGL